MSKLLGKWFDTVYVVVLENHGWNQVHQANCQFVNVFSNKGVIFQDWIASCHPSGPNYRTMMSGNWWSFNEFDAVHRPNIGDFVNVATIYYAGAPAPRHDPFLDMRASNRIVNSDNADIVYFGMDDNNDAHSGPLSVADGNVCTLLNTLQMKERDVFFLLFDEAFGPEWFTNHVFAGCLGPRIRTTSVTDRLTHVDFAAMLFDNWNLPRPQEMHPTANFDWGTIIS